MPVSNQRHPAGKANVRRLEIMRHNGFESASEHAGKPWGNSQSEFTAFAQAEQTASRGKASEGGFAQNFHG
jgi:hypothetical protein